MLLYIHVPFCRRRCRYCAFHSEATGSRPLPEDYVPGLLAELACWHDHLADLAATPAAGQDGRLEPVTSIFFGGGTPSLLDARDVGRLLDAMAGLFPLAKHLEVTLEGNPDSLNEGTRVADLKRAGVNRLSMGVQSLCDEELRLLGRLHNAKDVHRACEAVHRAGFASLNLDLMWGLPGQSTQGWLRTLQGAMALGPDHVSAYALTLEEGTELERMVGEGSLHLPDEETLEAMFLEGASLLGDCGLVQYEISNFARKGHACRHNLGYWHGNNYLGLGPSAVGTLNGARFCEPEDHALWLANVRGGVLPVPEPLSAGTRLLETVMLRLRTRQGLPLALYRRLCQRDFLADHGLLVRGLVQDGLARFLPEGDDAAAHPVRLALTRRGMLVSNDILARLFEDMDEACGADG